MRRFAALLLLVLAVGGCGEETPARFYCEGDKECEEMLERERKNDPLENPSY